MLPSTLRIAWRNLGRNRRRAFFAVTAIAIGQFAFLASAALLQGYAEQYFGAVTGPVMGHIQVHMPTWRESRSPDLALSDVGRILEEIRGDPQVAQAAPRLLAPTLTALAEDGFMSMVVGIDPEVESHADGLLGADSLTARLGEKRVLVGASFARKHGIRPGMELAVVGQDIDGSIANDLFRVAGALTTLDAVVNNLGIVMSLTDAQAFLQMPDQSHEIIIHVRDQQQLDTTTARLSALPALARTEVLTWREVAPYIVAILEMMEVNQMIILLIVFVAAAVGIANTMLMSTFERTHEFGMLLSLGCSPNRLSRIIALEAILLGLIGVVIGSLLVLVLVWGTSGSGVDYAALGGSDTSYEVAYQGLQLSSRVFLRIHPEDIGAGLIAVFLTSCLSVLWPMLRIVRLEPMEALRA